VKFDDSVKSHNPLFVHSVCVGHTLQLDVKEACEVPEADEGMFVKMLSFINYSDYFT
jgi:hypothetical protein